MEWISVLYLVTSVEEDSRQERAHLVEEEPERGRQASDGDPELDPGVPPLLLLPPRRRRRRRRRRRDGGGGGAARVGEGGGHGAGRALEGGKGQEKVICCI